MSVARHHMDCFSGGARCLLDNEDECPMNPIRQERTPTVKASEDVHKTLTVYKYPLPEPETQFVLPKGARVLHVATQDGVPTLWALVSPDASEEPREFVAFGTGHEIPAAESLEYVGTAHDVAGLGLVFHVFERTKPTGPVCPRCFARTVKCEGSTSTAMGVTEFTDENGKWHRHDPNRRSGQYLCTSCGTRWSEPIGGKCWCGWTRKPA